MSVGPREPEPRQAGQHAALVGDRRRQDDVEGADAGPTRRAAAGPSPTAYRSRTLPERRNASAVELAGDMDSRPPGCRVGR